MLKQPSSDGRNLNISEYTAAAQHLVGVNSQLQWAEGAYRGYCKSKVSVSVLAEQSVELHLNRQNATAIVRTLAYAVLDRANDFSSTVTPIS
jgi:hypothetical protein